MNSPFGAPGWPTCAAMRQAHLVARWRSWCAKVVTRSGSPGTENGDVSVSRRLSLGDLRDRRARRRQHERLARADGHAAPAHLHVHAVPVALAIAGPLLDAQQVVGGNLRGQPLEDRLAGAGDVEQRAERHRGQPLEPLHLQAPIGLLGRGLLADGHVAAPQIEHEHVDRGPGLARQRGQRRQLVLVLDRQPLGQEDQRLVALDRGQLAAAAGAGPSRRSRRPREPGGRSRPTG